ncbi:MAG: shikimate dehydrogenase [Pseudomonadota bacterium]
MSLSPATRPTMYFFGVSTGKSSINKVFPAWSQYLGLDATLSGLDFPPDDDPKNYRKAVAFVKDDPLSLGGLVTTHKVNLFKASRALFDELDPFARTLGEVSCLSKRDGRLMGHAKDPITVGAALKTLLPPDHFSTTGGEMVILGAGGSALALTLHLHQRHQSGADTPKAITVTAIAEQDISEMRKIHGALGFGPAIRYVLTPTPAEADALVSALPAGSMVVNATGLGKDRPGSPLTDAARFPEGGIAWEFNYRGDLTFLHQARSQAGARGLTVSDGWVYFVHGWTRVIAEVFHVEIEMEGPRFDALSKIAQDATS